MFTPMIGNIAAIGILVIGCVALFAVEKLMDRRRQIRYLPRPSHKGATYRVTNAGRRP